MKSMFLGAILLLSLSNAALAKGSTQLQSVDSIGCSASKLNEYNKAKYFEWKNFLEEGQISENEYKTLVLSNQSLNHMFALRCGWGKPEKSTRAEPCVDVAQLRARWQKMFEAGDLSKEELGALNYSADQLQAMMKLNGETCH